MPANLFEVSTWISMEVLRQVTNPMEFAPFFNTDYNGELTKPYPIGDSFQVPFPKAFLPNDDNTLGYTPQPIASRHATVTLDRVAKVHFEWDALEAALRLPRPKEAIQRNIIMPAKRALLAKIESDCAKWAYLNTPNVVGILGTNPASFDAVYGAAGQRIAEVGGIAGDHGMFLTPGVTRALRATVVSQFNPPDAISKMWKSGSIGEANGFDTYQSAFVYRHTAGTWAGNVSITTTQTGTAAINSLTLTCTNGDTFKTGDRFNIALVNDVNYDTKRSTGTLKQFVYTGVNQTISGTSATITFTPDIYGPGSPFQNVDALPVATSLLTLWPGTSSPNGKVGAVNIAMGKNAFALVGVPLDLPPVGGSVVISSQTRDPNSGLSVGVLRMFEPTLMRWINRIDCAYGFGNFWNDRDSVAVASA
jgi:hypothetical protein